MHFWKRIGNFKRKNYSTGTIGREEQQSYCDFVKSSRCNCIRRHATDVQGSSSSWSITGFWNVLDRSWWPSRWWCSHLRLLWHDFRLELLKPPVEINSNSQLSFPETTSIPHDSQSPTNVGHCFDPGCYSRPIHYNASSRQMSALVELSAECHQSIKVIICFVTKPLLITNCLFN